MAVRIKAMGHPEQTKVGNGQLGFFNDIQTNGMCSCPETKQKAFVNGKCNYCNGVRSER